MNDRMKRIAATGVIGIASLGLVGVSAVSGPVASAGQATASTGTAIIAADPGVPPGKAGGKVCKRKYTDQYGRSYCIKWA